MKDTARRIVHLTYGLWIVAALTLVFAYAVIYLPTMRQIDERWLQTAVSKAETDRALQTLANLQKVERARSRMHALIANVVSRNGPRASASLVRVISSIGRQYGVAVTAIENQEEPDPAREDGRLLGTGLTVDVRGSFAATLAFVSALSASEPLLNVDRVAMATPSRSGKRGAIETRIQATVYRLTPAATNELS